MRVLRKNVSSSIPSWNVQRGTCRRARRCPSGRNNTCLCRETRLISEFRNPLGAGRALSPLPPHEARSFLYQKPPEQITRASPGRVSPCKMVSARCRIVLSYKCCTLFRGSLVSSARSVRKRCDRRGYREIGEKFGTRSGLRRAASPRGHVLDRKFWIDSALGCRNPARAPLQTLSS